MKLVFVLTLCTSALVWKCSSLFVMKFINENMYSHGRVKISSLLNYTIWHMFGPFGRMLHCYDSVYMWSGCTLHCIISDNAYVPSSWPAHCIIATAHGQFNWPSAELVWQHMCAVQFVEHCILFNVNTFNHRIEYGHQPCRTRRCKIRCSWMMKENDAIWSTEIVVCWHN
jgi:hypothetical protein